MPTLFIAGSIAIQRLHPDAVKRIANAVEGGMEIVVGDADGADRSIQQTLLDLGATAVTVFCSGEQPRNNLGGWPVRTIEATGKPGTRAWFTAKDVAMAAIADYGLMIWDARSTGTLSNVMELLARGKTSVVFVDADLTFVTVTSAETLEHLVGLMSAAAIGTAERKIGLNRRVAAFRAEQFALSV